MEDNQICSCAFVLCDRCMFDMGEANSCDATRIEWLYQEYKEPVVLTDDEQALCKLLGRGWIARDKNDNLYWYDHKPDRYYNTWMQTSQLRCKYLGDIFSQCKFDFIKWEDEEPWEVKVDD